MIISTAVVDDDADPVRVGVAATNGGRDPPPPVPVPPPAASNNLDPAAASLLADVVRGAAAGVGAGTSTTTPPPWWSSGSASLPTPVLQSHGADDIGYYYAGSMMDTVFFPQLPAPPPEVTPTTTTGAGPPPIYADTSAVGVRFDPTDQQLIEYLRMKHYYSGGRQQQMPVDFFREFDVYRAHPTAIKGACGESQNGCWYAFSPRERKYRNGARPARSVYAEIAGGGKKKAVQQVGFWKSNSKLGVVRDGGREDGAVIGRKTSLTFQVGVQPRGTQTGWKMKEYTIPENQHQPDGSAMLLNDWVFCKLFYKERPAGCGNTKSKTDESGISAGLEQQQGPMHGNSEKDKHAATSVGVGQKRPRCSRKSKKDKDAIAVAVAVAAGEASESVQQAEEDNMQQRMMVPAAHQASDYSEQQDLCVEDYLVCDVAFAQ